MPSPRPAPAGAEGRGGRMSRRPGFAWRLRHPVRGCRMLALYTHTGESRAAPADLGTAALPPGVVWIDAVAPSAGEIAYVERATGLHIPTFEELSEIESSSRLRADEGVLYMSAPAVHRAIAGEPRTTPVGFVLDPELLVTVRFEQLAAFDNFAKAKVKAET